MRLRNLIAPHGLCIGLLTCCGSAIAQDGMLPPLRPAEAPAVAPWLNPEGQKQFQSESPAATEIPATQQYESTPNNVYGRPTQSAPPASFQPTSGEPPIRRLLNQETAPATSSPRYDPSLQPAAWQTEQTRTQPGSAAARPKTAIADSLLKELEIAGDQHVGNFQPMGLHDMLANCEMNRRMEMIRQYWNTWQACSEYQFAVDELRWLEQVGQPRDESERLVLDAAHSTIADAMVEKELAMTRHQQALNRFLTGPESETLPWPTDSPLIGNYDTHYDLYAARGLRSGRMQAIHQWMPRQLELIVSRAVTVQRCRNAILRSTQNFSQQGGGSATMLQALYLSRESHSAFLKSVADYNRGIAEYALTVKPNQAAAEQVVAMLIPVFPVDSTVPATDSGLRQASLPGTEYYGARNNEYDASQPTVGNQPGGVYSRPPTAFTPANQPPALRSGGGFNAGEYNGGGQPGYSPSANPGGPPQPPSAFRR